MSRRCDQPAGHIGYGDLFIVLQISVRTDRIRPPHLVRHVRDRILTEYLLRLIGIERRSRQLLKPVDSPDMIKVSVGEQDPLLSGLPDMTWQLSGYAFRIRGAASCRYPVVLSISITLSIVLILSVMRCSSSLLPISKLTRMVAVPCLLTRVFRARISISFSVSAREISASRPFLLLA